VFRRLASLRKLDIQRCKKLTGRTQQEASSKQSTSSVLPPHLESLRLWFCNSLVEVPTLPASLRKLQIEDCDKLESVLVRKQEKSAPLQGSCSEPMHPPNLSLKITGCHNLLSLSVQLDCTDLQIVECRRLKSLDGDLPSLEHLILDNCHSLESIPDVPQAYFSLRDLTIRRCPRLELLPPYLKQRLNHIKDKDLDDRYTGNELLFLRPLFYYQKCPSGCTPKFNSQAILLVTTCLSAPVIIFTFF
jgi:hypothetical protein